MANYERHATVAKQGGVVFSLLVFVSVFYFTGEPLWAIGLAGVCGLLVFLGGIAPDIDHPSAIPRRHAVTLGRLGVVVTVPTAAYIYWEPVSTWTSDAAEVVVPSVTPAAATGSLVAVLLAVILTGLILVPVVIDKATGSHRTRTHSWKTVGVLAVLVGAGGSLATGRLVDTPPLAVEYVGGALALAVVVGFGLHFKEDGILLGR